MNSVYPLNPFDKMTPKVLYSNQQRHLNRLFDILLNHFVACDTSSTGSGKTIVAVKLAQQLKLPMVIVGPPTLRANWETTCDEEGVARVFISSSAISLNKVPFPSYLLVVDEFHLFKNDSQRNHKLSRLQLASGTRYTLLLSATLFDHPRQQVNIRKVLGPNREVFNLCSQMAYQYPTRLTYTFFHVLQTADEKTLYKKGRKLIASALRPHGQTPVIGAPFSPAVFQKGFQFIHASLIAGLIRAVERAVRAPHKIVVSLKFKQHFEMFTAQFPRALVLNGSTSYMERKRVIALFQEPSLEHQVLVLTDVVGGVGIDLDDQHGGFPRQVFCLPSFATDFIQLVGRVRRRNSRSDSKVSVIQPHLLSTYFTQQMKVKGAILGRFNQEFNLSTFQRAVEHQEHCAAAYPGRITGAGADVDDLIREMVCGCLPFAHVAKRRRARVIR